jgi:circadian clock protein KaiC
VTTRKNATPRPLSKMATGIQGFDEISRGGLPRNRTSLVMGGPGTGKTVFALQALANAARKRRLPGIFVAFEEGAGEIFANASTFDWALPALAKSALFFLSISTSSELSLRFTPLTMRRVMCPRTSGRTSCAKCATRTRRLR